MPNIDKAAPSWEKDLFTAAGCRSHLFLPIDWADKRLAVLSIHSRAERLWRAEQISLINTFCGFVAVVLENSGLYREAEDRAKALEEVNRELQNAVNVKTRFLGKVSHELRSPLCVIMGYANLIAEETFGALPLEMGQVVERILKQVLIHVLDNAVKFTDAGKIVLRGRAEKGSLDITVEDTGIGIDPEHQKFIFNGFRQVDDDDARRYDGMGIGLYLARRFLDLLGGEIRVESEPGSGSRFKIRLPCNAAA